MRFGGAVPAAADAMPSSHGTARAVPSPFNTVRRLMRVMAKVPSRILRGLTPPARLSLPAPLLERIAFHDLQHQARELVILVLQSPDDVINRTSIEILYPTTQGVGKHFFAQAAGEC